MRLTGIYAFDAPVETVWQLLLDTEAVGRCLPGCRGLRPIGDDRFEVELSVAVAAISGDFKGTVALADQVPCRSYKLLVEASGRPGFVKGAAVVTLAADGTRTRVDVSADAQVGGMAARVGQRLLEGVGRTTMDRFFACMAASLH
jgi:carbon monoxide dehydrogenase subunit G